MLRRRSPRVVLVNAAGWGNVGDDAIVLAMASRLRRLEARPTLVCVGGPDAAAVLRTVDCSATGITSGTFRSRVRVLFEIATADVVIVGGGGLLHDRVPGFYRPFTRATRAAQLLGVPYLIHAVGSYSPTSAEFGRALDRTCLGATYVTARDQESADVLIAHGAEHVVVVPDPAFSYDSPPRAVGAPGPVVGVSARPLWQALTSGARLRKTDWLLRTLADVLARQSHHTKFVMVAIQVGGPEGDEMVLRPLAQALSERGFQCEVVLPRTPTEAIEAFSRCDVVLGMRLHSVILATAAEIPSVALAYEPKVAHALAALGRGDLAVPISADGLAQLPELLERAVQTESFLPEARSRKSAAASALDDLADAVANCCRFGPIAQGRSIDRG